MVRELSGHDPDETHAGWRRRYVDFYGDRMQRSEAALFFAECDGRPIGMAAVYLSATHRTEIFRQRSAYVSNVYVMPPWRRKGIAAHLTSLTVEWAKTKGCETVRLRTSKMGRPVYESLGFVPSEELELRL
jgi:GNAT superfamily N-acetyltransferase